MRRTRYPALCRALLLVGALAAAAAPAAAAAAAAAGRLERRRAAATAELSKDPRPVWHRSFSVGFNETTKLFLLSWTTDGVMYYDADQQAELVRRDNGKGDRYCMSIHPLTATPCTHLVTGGQRFLIFPELGECCRCCDAAAGCGILDPHWLDGAEYIGQVMSQGRLAFEWAIRGLQPNQYYATADGAFTPLQLDQQPNDLITFHPESFAKGPVDPSVFSLPPGACADRCPLTSVCTLLQLRASAVSGEGLWAGAAKAAAGLLRRAAGGGGRDTSAGPVPVV